MDANDKVREAIRQAMKQQNLTQKDVAGKLGIKQPSVAQIVSGDRGTIPKSLLDVIEVLGLELCLKPKSAT